MLLAPYGRFQILVVYVTEWPRIEKIAAHSAYDTFSWYKYLIVNLVFSHLGFWSGNRFLIAPFPDLCLLVPFYVIQPGEKTSVMPCTIHFIKIVLTYMYV